MTSERSHRSIGEVLSLLQEEFPDITISKIRFLESQGLLEPERTPSGYRKFFDPDVERLRWILLQQRDHFLPLKVIRERLGAGEFESWVVGGADPAALAPVAVQPPLGPEVAPQPPQAGTSRPARAVNGETPEQPVAPIIDDAVGASAAESRLDDGVPAAPGELAEPPAAPEEVVDEASVAPDEAVVPTPGPVAEPDDAEPHRFDAILSAARRAADRDDTAVADPREVPASEPVPAADERVEPPPPLDAGPLDTGAAAGSMTVDELCRASGLDPQELGELERFGLLASRAVGPAVYYDGEALVVARLAAAFLRHGIEARHLRMYKTAAEREAGVFEQVVAPLVGRHDPAARREARERLVEMARLGEALHAALLRSALRGYVESD